MGENKKSFEDEIRVLAEIAEKTEEIDFLLNEEINIKVQLPYEKYDYILSHFREVDRNRGEFNIKFDNVKFNFVLKK